jgi:hypothetical protein
MLPRKPAAWSSLASWEELVCWERVISLLSGAFRVVGTICAGMAGAGVAVTLTRTSTIRQSH